MISKIEENIKVLDDWTWKCTALVNEIDSSMRDIEGKLNNVIIWAKDEKHNKSVKEILDVQASEITKFI